MRPPRQDLTVACEITLAVPLVLWAVILAGLAVAKVDPRPLRRAPRDARLG